MPTKNNIKTSIKNEKENVKKLNDLDVSCPETLDTLLEKLEALSKNQQLKDMFYRDDISDKFDLKSEKGNKEAQIFVGKRILSNIPALMKNAKNELAEYFSLRDGITVEEYYKNLTFGKFYNDVRSLINDETFINFFICFAVTEVQT